MSRRVVVAVASFALAAPAQAASPPQLQVLGAYDAGCSAGAIAPPGTFCTPLPARFAYWANPTGVGQRAKGLFLEQPLRNGVPTTTRRGIVKCLSVAGKAAVIGGIFTAPLYAFGIPFVEYAVDNGPPGSGTPDLEGLLGAFPPGDPDWIFLPVGFPNACPSPTAPIYGYVPLSAGDVVIR